MNLRIAVVVACSSLLLTSGCRDEAEDDAGGGATTGASATTGAAGETSDGGSTGADATDDASDESTSTGAPPAMLDGEQLFAAHCSACHGVDAGGGELAPQIRNPVVGFATWVVRHGRDDMPFEGPMSPIVVEVLPDEDLAKIIAHLRGFAVPDDGEGLYLRFCGNCHGADAWGGRVGVDLTHEASEGVEEFLEIVREGHGGADYGARTEYMPAWPADEITDDDVAAIVAWLQTVAPGPGEGEEEDDDDGEEEDDGEETDDGRDDD
jgi:mono/diheme cytochrome c family protein